MIAKLLLAVVGLVCVGLTGCGAGKVNVEGTVVSGGQPYLLKPDEYLTVNISSEDGTGSFSGKVTKEATFAIETQDGRGVPPGKYKIMLSRYQTPSAAVNKGKPTPPVTLTADEVWEVSSSNRTFTIDVSKYR